MVSIHDYGFPQWSTIMDEITAIAVISNNSITSAHFMRNHLANPHYKVLSRQGTLLELCTPWSHPNRITGNVLHGMLLKVIARHA